MKILCFTDNLSAGGAQRQLTSIACELKKRGHNVEMAVYYPQRAPKFFQMLDEIRIPVIMLEKHSRFSLGPVWKLFYYVNNNDFDIVLAFQETPSLYAEIASIGWRRTRLIVSERNSMPHQLQTKKMWFYRLFHYFADKVTTNSYFHSEWLQFHFPWLQSKVTTIYNGVDLALFKPVSGRIHNSDEVRLLAIGRIAKQKNPFELVKALAICRYEYGLNVNVAWIGEINTGEMEYYSELVKLITAERLDDSWFWIRHFTDISNLYKEYDALILPSFYEGLPNVVCEALASGLPVLLSNVCDHPRLVQNGQTGLLFDPVDAHDIAKKIRSFYNMDEDYRRKMGAQARINAERELDMQVMVGEYEKLMNNIRD